MVDAAGTRRAGRVAKGKTKGWHTEVECLLRRRGESCERLSLRGDQLTPLRTFGDYEQ
jgi:hypothetical protein